MNCTFPSFLLTSFPFSILSSLLLFYILYTSSPWPSLQPVASGDPPSELPLPISKALSAPDLVVPNTNAPTLVWDQLRSRVWKPVSLNHCERREYLSVLFLCLGLWLLTIATLQLEETCM